MAGMVLPYWKCFAAETLSDSRFQSWDVAERGAFWTLLNIQWREGAIPADMTTLAKLLHVDGGAMRSLWSAIGDRFVPHPDHPGKLANPRMEEEREEALASVNQKKRAGKLGAESRWSSLRKQNSAAMAAPSLGDAGPMADDGDQIKQPTKQDPIQAKPRPRLVSPFAAGTDPYPQTTAVLAALWDRGIDAAPPAERSAPRVEAAIVAVTIPVAADRLAAVYANPEAKKPLTYHVDAIRGAKPRPRNVGDLGSEIVQWPQRLTEDEARAYANERTLIDPDLDGAPIGIPGDRNQCEDLNAKWRAIAEGR
jgi:hypothetical protein